MSIKESIKSQIFSMCDRVYLSKLKTVDNRIVFLLNRAHEDNSLVLFEYIYAEEGQKYEYAFIVKNDEYDYYRDFFKEYNAAVYSYKNNFLNAITTLSTSRYVFFMHGIPFKYIAKKEDQIVVNLWHGSGYKDALIARNGTDFDCVLVPGRAHIEPKARFFSCETDKVLPIGYPRYDLFKKAEKRDGNYISAVFKKSSSKLIIWMPTYRETDEVGACGPESKIKYSFDLPLLNSKEELIRLDEYCKQMRVSLLIKRHPHQKKYSCEIERLTNIYFADNEQFSKEGIVIYSLLNFTDAMISDYSSVAVDYLLLDKPIAFVLDDFEQYRATRGFVFDDPLKYMPGHHLYTLQDMLAFINDVASGNDPYKANRDAIMHEVHNPCDNYCERVWKTVKKLSMEVD